MVKVVLFDLDGTLVPIEVETFLKGYTKAIGIKIAHLMDPKTFIKHLLDATNKMIENKNAETTNEQVFWKYFSGKISVPENIIVPVLDEFYKKDFPLLGSTIDTNRRGAVLVKKLKENGFRLVLATNPLFPKEAVIERMRWAFLDPADFELITTYENMHFCKPHPEYYQEILEYLDEDPAYCMMVGNDVEEDMVAGKLGMKTFLLNHLVIDRGSGIPYEYSGDFNKLSQVLGVK
ncbi:MAG TPA: HAD family hydrolase [Clostridia bacterium]|nr:HAD family hydrolase [Clostridia bacterium]